jgi:hypothetical protein
MERDLQVVLEPKLTISEINFIRLTNILIRLINNRFYDERLQVTEIKVDNVRNIHIRKRLSIREQRTQRGRRCLER